MKLELLDELEQQHRDAEGLIRRLSDAEDVDEQRVLVDELVCAMTDHMNVEESEVYPEMERIDGVLEEEAEIEHDWARVRLQQLSDMVGTPGFGAAVAIVAAGIADHIDDEEADAFPKLRQALTGTQETARSR